MIEILQQYSNAFMFLTTIVLVVVTAFYAYWTKGILKATVDQSKLSLNPVIGIGVKEMTISEVFGPNRRNMLVDIELTNVGNAPAIEVLVDAEIELRYSNINGEKIIPARFEPAMIPFIEPGKRAGDISLCFGSKFITHFFDDVRESNRLNLHRIETNPTRDAYKTSRLTVYVYCRNSLGQNYRSHFETEISIWSSIDKDPIPKDDETAKVSMTYIPRPIFHAGIVDEHVSILEIMERNKLRKYCGW